MLELLGDGLTTWSNSSGLSVWVFLSPVLVITVPHSHSKRSYLNRFLFLSPLFWIQGKHSPQDSDVGLCYENTASSFSCHLTVLKSSFRLGIVTFEAYVFWPDCSFLERRTFGLLLLTPFICLRIKLLRQWSHTTNINKECYRYLEVGIVIPLHLLPVVHILLTSIL